MSEGCRKRMEQKWNNNEMNFRNFDVEIGVEISWKIQRKIRE